MSNQTKTYQIASIGKNKAVHGIRIDENGDIRTLCRVRYHIDKSGEPVPAKEVTCKLCLSAARQWAKDGVEIIFE